MAQIQLLTIDAPLVVYNTKKDKKEKNKKPKFGEVQNAAAKWKQKYKDSDKKLSINLSEFN